MFDFLKKSRVFNFLCSTCLLCSLGSFVMSADDESISNIPGKVDDTYLQGPLGFESDHIVLDGAKINTGSGLISNGTLKWKITTFSKEPHISKTLDEALDTLDYEIVMKASGWTSVNQDEITPDPVERWDGTFWYLPSTPACYEWYDDSNIKVSSSSESFDSATELAWKEWKDRHSYEEKLQQIIDAGWEQDTEKKLFDLVNPNENSKLALFLKSGDDYVGATSEIDLSTLGEDRFNLTGVKFYDSTTDDVVTDESSATPLSCKPGVYPLYAILTEKGDKTLISEPVADNSDES